MAEVLSASEGAAVPSSFATPPRMASQFRERFEHSEAGQATSQQSQQTPPEPRVESQHVAQGGSHPPLQTNPLDKPFVEQQPSEPQPPVTPQTHQQPYVDPRLVQQLAQERDALRQQVQTMAQQQYEWQEAQRQQSLQAQLMESPELQNLESVDPEDARRIAGAVANSMDARFAQLQNELAQQRADSQRNMYALQQRERAQFDKKNAEAVIQKHPDFFDLYQNSAEFRQFLNGHDGYSSKTREQAATEEFYAGNTAYVIDLMDRFKAGRPNNQNNMTVAPVQVAGAATAQQGSAPQQPSYTLADLNNLMQTRQISQDEYRERLKAWRAANSR